MDLGPAKEDQGTPVRMLMEVTASGRYDESALADHIVTEMAKIDGIKATVVPVQGAAEKESPKRTPWHWFGLLCATLVLMTYIASIADEVSDIGVATFLMPFGLGVGVMAWIWTLVSDIRKILDSK